MSAVRRGPRRLLAATAVGVLLALASAPTAQAADGAIDNIERTDTGFDLLVSVPPDAVVETGSVQVTVDGTSYDATAGLAVDDSTVRRTTILAIDTSNSMAGARIEAAKLAATTFLDTVPDDVFVGVVTFDSSVTEALSPTQDRAAARAVVDGLELRNKTLLYDGVLAAVELAGTEGQRSVLVLSDGDDTGTTPLSAVTSAIDDAEVLVDVVALERSAASLGSLGLIAGDGEVISADSEALAAAFSDEAEALADQIAVSVTVPAEVAAEQSSIEVVLASSVGEIVSGATVPGTGEPAEPPVAAPLRAEPVTALPGWVMYAGVGVFGAGLIVAMVMLVPAKPVPMSAAQRVTSYTSGGPGGGGGAEAKPEGDAALAQAQAAMAGVLNRNKGLDERIGARLEGAGSDLKSSEWLLLHLAIFVGSGVVGLLVGTGSLVIGLVFMLFGAVGPWIWLGLRKSRRRKKFNSLLPETLQLMSGSLSAGLSLSQTVDTIVREGQEPVASEFKRVLVETRIGIPLEDAFQGVADRFDSKDFGWVVMAIKIQRQVGGNLAELLNTVAATMREREYLRRQVNALAAEGKLSAYVLGGLPPLFLLYLVFAQREYVSVMFTDGRGILMMIGAGLWLGVGILWMKKLIKVEV